MAALQVRLVQLAALGQTVTYGALARDLGVPGPGSIAQLTAMLEALMIEDAAAGRPLRASLCAGRLAGGMPAQGFFDKAADLGVLVDMIRQDLCNGNVQHFMRADLCIFARQPRGGSCLSNITRLLTSLSCKAVAIGRKIPTGEGLWINLQLSRRWWRAF